METVCKKNTPEGSDVGSNTVWRAFRYPIENFSPRGQKSRISPPPSLAISGLGGVPGAKIIFGKWGVKSKGQVRATQKRPNF